MKHDHKLTVARLRELLDYDPETGLFRWKIRSRPGCRVGDVAGTTDSGRRVISLDGKRYLAHRLAWMYVYGAWPADMLDHRNENKSDNRITNLREATNAQNAQNVSHARGTNLSGYLGVSPHRQRWQAQIGVDGKNRGLGLFDSPDEAHAAYLAAKERLHPFWACRNEGATA